MNAQTNSVDYASVLADLKAKRDALDKAIASIEAVAGQMSGGIGPVSGGTSDDLKDDSFLGMNITDAAKKLLAMKKKALSTNEIAELLKRGGMVGSDNFANSVGVALHREDKNEGDIMKIGRGTWGLTVWYPGKKRGGKKSNGEEGVDKEEI